MRIFDRITSRITPTHIITVDESLTGAYGGVPPRITPLTTKPVFKMEPGQPFDSIGIVDDEGLAPIIAARPPSAPMLANSDYHTQIITATGFVRRTKAVDFTRPGNQGNVHDAAVDSVVHSTDPDGVHPTTRRAILRGQSPG